MELLGIEMPFEEFDRLMCEQGSGKELKVIDGKVIAVEHETTEQELKEQRISELKKNLYDTDYQAIKYAEGELTAEEYAPIKEQRRQWRAEINELEATPKNKPQMIIT